MLPSIATAAHDGPFPPNRDEAAIAEGDAFEALGCARFVTKPIPAVARRKNQAFVSDGDEFAISKDNATQTRVGDVGGTPANSIRGAEDRAFIADSHKFAMSKHDG